MTPDSRKFEAVIFDMDGTLLDSHLDFDAIRRDIGVTGSDGIIEHIQALPANSRQQAEEILLNHELSAARQAGLINGAEALLTTLANHGVPMGLLTRNTRRAFDIAAENFEVMRLFNHVRCREDGIIKPEPDGIWAVCEELNVAPENTLCVGDFEFDMIAAQNAGAVAVLYTSFPKWKEFAHRADIVIDTLDQICELLRIPKQ